MPLIYFKQPAREFQAFNYPNKLESLKRRLGLCSTDVRETCKSKGGMFSGSVTSDGEYFCPVSEASTNDLESILDLMKRGYKGVYHHWNKKHLHRYIDKFSFRLDKGNYEIDTTDRVLFLVQGSVNNKRLTYEKLTS